MKTYLIDDHRCIFEAVVASEIQKKRTQHCASILIDDEDRRRAVVGEKDICKASR